MALTVANVGRGNYVLGGLGRVEGPSAAEAMDLAQREEQRFRDAQRAARQTELGMQETRQRMALAQSAEQRAQQTFQAQQSARAQAAANAAQRRAATAALMEGLSGLSAPAAGSATGAAPIAPVAPPRAGLAMPTGSGVPLSFGTAIPSAAPATTAPATPTAGTPLSMGVPAPAPAAGGVQVASLDPMESFRLALEARPDLFGGGVQVADASGAVPAGALPTGQPVRAEFGGVPFDVYPDGRVVNTLTNTELPATGEYDALRAALVQQAGLAAPTGVQPDLGAVLAGLGIRPEDFVRLTPGEQADILSFADPTAGMRERTAEMAAPYTPAEGRGRGFFAETLMPGRAAEIRAAEAATQRAIEAGTVTRPTRAELPSPEAVSAQATAVTGTEPASPEAAAAEAPTTAEEAAPVVETPYGGLQLNFGTPVQLSFGEFDGRGSEAYVAAPERIFQDTELASRQQQRLSLLATYYQQTNNLEGLVGVMNQLDELSVEQRYLDGMTAIVGIQQENFGPVQALLQQRYPGRQVEVRPYTDGTVEIFLDGQAEARLTWDDLATNLRSVYDRGFIAEQQAVAEQARARANELWTLQTTELLRTQREIAVARNQAEIDRLEGSGSIERIGETANGEVIFERVVNGVPIQFVYREVMTRDPITGDEIPALVATPIDQMLVQ